MGATIIRLFLLLALTMPPGVQDQASRKLTHAKVVGATSEEAKKGKVGLWALIIGISNYKYGDQDIDGLRITNLAYATTDAESVYEFLQSAAGGAFRDVSKGGHMVLLEDEEATKANIEKALDSLKEAKPEDYFIIYVAGHGHIVRRKVADPATGKQSDVAIPYFVVHDTNPRDWPGTGVDMAWFRQKVEHEIPARRGLVLLDTCHSGGIVQSGMLRGESELANQEFHEQLKQVQGIGFISAAGALEASIEKRDLDHGVFTYCLLQALRGAADEDRDGMVVFNEAVGFVKREVPKRTDGRQNPYDYTTWINANFIPLSIVRYATVISDAAYATLVIRNPAVDGVEVAIDNEPPEDAPVGVEVSTQVTAGAHKISFSQKGAPKNELPVQVGDGEIKEIEIKLCFTQNDEEARPSSLPVSANLPDKEPSPQAQDFFHKGVDSFNRQKFKEAHDLFNRAIQASGGAYSRALVYRGRTEQSLGLHKQAVKSFKEALDLKPTDFETQTLMAEAKFVAGGDAKEVYDTLRYITTTYPTFDFAHVVLGDVLLWRHETIRAERELRRAIALNPKSPPAHLILADALTHQAIKEKQIEAVTEAEKALQLFEELSSKQVKFKGLSLSHLIFGGGRYVNAAAMCEAHYMLAKALTRAVEYEPLLAERKVYLDRARGSIQEAMKLAQGLSDKIRLAQVLLTSAENYLLKEDITSAIRDGEQALKLSDPTPRSELKALVHHLLYRAYNSNQKCAKAADQLRAYIDLYKVHMSQAERDQYDGELERLRNCADANRQKE